MSKNRGSRFSIVFIICILILFGAVAEGLADNIAPEVQTQLNERTDLFQKSVDNLPSLEKSLEEKNQATISAMGDGKTSMPQGLSSITKQSKSELENESGKLESIHENDLNNIGRDEMIKKNILNELYPDYSRPLNKQYMKDAKALSEGQNKLLASLLAKLKAIGVDCKTIKGDAKHEPEYFIKINTTNHKDTIYNQTFCEELRDKYHCNDEVALKCSKRGMKWSEWQDKQIRVPGGELIKSGKAVFWVDHTGKKCFEYKLSVQGRKSWFGQSQPDLYVVNQMREFLATKHKGSTIDNISTDMFSWWEGGLFSISGWSYCGRVLGSKDYAWSTYVINYKYRDGHEICEQWSEDWTERCRLQ
jgi:hypothetical protein